MRATICSTMCLLKVMITKSFCGREKSSHREPGAQGKPRLCWGDTLCSFPSSSYPAFPPPLFIFLWKEAGDNKKKKKKKAVDFLPLFAASLHFLQCFCSLVLPILILPKLPFPEAPRSLYSINKVWVEKQPERFPASHTEGKITGVSPLFRQKQPKIPSAEQRKSLWAPVRLG